MDRELRAASTTNTPMLTKLYIPSPSTMAELKLSKKNLREPMSRICYADRRIFVIFVTYLTLLSLNFKKSPFKRLENA